VLINKNQPAAVEEKNNPSTLLEPTYLQEEIPYPGDA
jgi:hypothetical protein